MRILAALLSTLLTISSAQAASSIDPTIPPQGAPYAPGPIRGNFGHAISDINALQTLNAGASAPSNPTLGYLWLQTPQNATVYNLKFWDGAAWLPVASLDTVTHTWMPPVGGGVLPNVLSATTTDLGSVPQASLYVTGNNAIQAFGSTSPAGAVKLIIFTGTPTVIDNPASMILPGAANITQAIGDTAIALHLGGGNWQVLFNSRVSGGGGSGCGGGTCQFPLGEGFTVTPGTDNATPLTIGTNTLYGQIVPVSYSAPHTVTTLEMGHLVAATGSVSVPFQLPTAGGTGFELGTSLCFEGDGSGGFTLAASGPSVLLGVPTSSGTATFPQYGSACAASDGSNWHVSSSAVNALPSLGSAHIFVGNSSNLATDVAVSGDVSITNSGAVTVNQVHGVIYPASPSLNTAPVVTSTSGGGTVTYEAVPNAALAHSSTTVNGQTCTLGGSCSITASPGSLTDTHIFVGNGSNVATDVAASGDVSLLDTGAFTVINVNAVAYPSGPTVNTVPVVTNAAGGGTVTYESVPGAALAACTGAASNFACLSLANLFTAHQQPQPVSLTDGATITPLGTDANLYTLTVAGSSHTLACPSTIDFGTYNFRITNSGGVTGFATASCFKYPGGVAPTWSTTDTFIDVLSCTAFDNARLECNALINSQ